MREILFRGLTEKGERIEGQYHTYVDGVFICQTELMNNDGKDYKISATEVIPETVGQFTGLTDKNGVKEFEHDKVKVTWVTPSTGGYLQSDDAWCENEAICVIKYIGNRFVYVRSDGRQLSIRNDAKREVIGNIHDKPELLNQRI